eukprot:7218491-Prymnesium_polylepis.1
MAIVQKLQDPVRHVVNAAVKVLFASASEALQHPRPDVRKATLGLLAGPPMVVVENGAAIAQRLDDVDESVRRSAEEVLSGSIGAILEH